MKASIDRRQLETFLASPGVVGDVGPAVAREWGEQVGRKKAETKWLREGNIILPSGEFVSKEEFGRLPSDEQGMLRRLGVGGFNRFKEENIKLEDGSWLARKSSEFKVLDAVIDGYRTYEEIGQVTGLVRSEVDSAIARLRKRGLIK